MKIKADRWLLIAAAVGVAYAIYRAVNKVPEVVDQNIAKPIADMISALTLPGDVTVKGMMLLPTGAQVPISQLYIDNGNHFTYLGVKYTMMGRSADGQNYIARAGA